MKAIKIIIIAVIAFVAVIPDQKLQAQPCSGNKVRMAYGIKGCGCNCQKKCVLPSEVAAYQANGWYIGDCARLCCFGNGWRIGDPEINSLPTSLDNIYPNPASDIITIAFTMSTTEVVTLSIVDVAGRHVATIANEEMEDATYEVNWDVSSINPGIYFLKMKTRTYDAFRRISVIR